MIRQPIPVMHCLILHGRVALRVRRKPVSSLELLFQSFFCARHGFRPRGSKHCVKAGSHKAPARSWQHVNQPPSCRIFVSKEQERKRRGSGRGLPAATMLSYTEGSASQADFLSLAAKPDRFINTLLYNGGLPNLD